MNEKYALIIANTEYMDPGLAQLSAPGRDAKDFAWILKNKDVCAFTDVQILLNQPEHIVRRAIDDFFGQKKPDDLLILYFSGHGVRDDLGILYLAVKNTIRNRLRSTAIKSDYIRDAMDQSRSQRQVLILDCCNSGAFAQGTKAATGVSIGTATAFEAGYGRVILTASDSTQFAWEGDKIIGETDNSLFTHFLVKGLQGEADLDSDGCITVDELYDYTYEKVKRATPKQTPSKFSTKQQGEIVLRQNMPVDEIKQVPLPAELQDEIEDTRPYVREAAVQKLEKLLKGKNIGLALSAQEALKKIAADENSTRRVAQAAAQALQSATLPEAVEVKSDDHFPVKPQKEAEQRKTEEIRPLAGDGQQVIQNVVKKEQHPAQVVAARVVAQPIPRAQKPQSPGLSSLRTLRPFMAGVIFLLLCFTAGWFIRPYLMPFILKETPSPTATIEIVIPPPIITATPSPTSAITDMPSVVEPTPTSTPTQTATPFPTVTNTRDNPEKFIIDYFNMVVFDDDFARGWTFLTPEFQVNVAHGWDEYQRFWGTVKEWKLSNIQTDYNDFFRARITITYRLYYMNNKSDLVSGNKYCLLWNDEMNSWQFDIKSNCP